MPGKIPLDMVWIEEMTGLTLMCRACGQPFGIDSQPPHNRLENPPILSGFTTVPWITLRVTHISSIPTTTISSFYKSSIKSQITTQCVFLTYITYNYNIFRGGSLILAFFIPKPATSTRFYQVRMDEVLLANFHPESVAVFAGIRKLERMRLYAYNI